jgi:regulatory protein
MHARRAQAKLSLRGKALQWLAQREHSRQELEVKLLAWCHREHRKSERATVAREPDRASIHGFDADVARERIVATLEELTAAGHLSDVRYVASKVRQRSGKVGLARLKRELGSQGTQLSLEENKALAESEHSRALALWLRRYGPDPSPDASMRLKQMRFLASRGFSHDVIRRVVQGLQTAD